LALSNKAKVRVVLKPGPPDCPVLGKVNMDQIVIDLTDIAGEELSALRGLEVELISDDPDAPNALPALAKLARVHCYEMLCRLSPNIARKYRYEG
jgi:alanine racemase